jgi:hypothetical protein
MKLKLLSLVTGLFAFSVPGFAVPVIHEVFYDAAGADAPHVFTELVDTPGAALDGYRLVGIDGATGLVYRQIALTGALVPPDGILVIAPAQALGEILSVRDFIADVDWQNGPDAIQIWDAAGFVIDALQYGAAGALSLGEGLFAPDPDSGLALTRDLLGTDTGDNRADFQVATPTPGTGRTFAGSAGVPEPATTLVLLLGLVGVAVRGPAPSRRRGAWTRPAKSEVRSSPREG